MTRLVRAANPGPMTLEGTNTWLVGHGRVLVVDPGPAEPAHLDAVLGEVGRDGGRLGGVLLTHRHPDHAEALSHPVLQEALAATGVPVLALDPALGVAPEEGLLGRACDEPASVLPLPGHTDDSLALVLPRRREVLTGDTVLGRGTSVVAHPDGDLTDYLASLAALLRLTGPTGPTETGPTETGPTETGPTGTGPTGTGPPWLGLPGHGPVVADLAAAVRELQAHRLARVEQVRSALRAAGGGEPGRGPDPADDALVADVVARVYPDLADPVLVEAASRTVRATLVHLDRGPG